MRLKSLRPSLFWAFVLFLLAFFRVHFRSITTGVAYELGQLKTQEGKLLEQRSSLRGELAKLTTKKRLEDISSGFQDGDHEESSRK